MLQTAALSAVPLPISDNTATRRTVERAPRGVCTKWSVEWCRESSVWSQQADSDRPVTEYLWALWGWEFIVGLNSLNNIYWDDDAITRTTIFTISLCVRVCAWVCLWVCACARVRVCTYQVYNIDTTTHTSTKWVCECERVSVSVWVCECVNECVSIWECERAHVCVCVRISSTQHINTHYHEVSVCVRVYQVYNI